MFVLEYFGFCLFVCLGVFFTTSQKNWIAGVIQTALFFFFSTLWPHCGGAHQHWVCWAGKMFLLLDPSLAVQLWLPKERYSASHPQMWMDLGHRQIFWLLCSGSSTPTGKGIVSTHSSPFYTSLISKVITKRLHTPHNRYPSDLNPPSFGNAECVCPPWSSLACWSALWELSANAGHLGGCPGWRTCGC